MQFKNFMKSVLLREKIEETTPAELTEGLFNKKKKPATQEQKNDIFDWAWETAEYMALDQGYGADDFKVNTYNLGDNGGKQATIQIGPNRQTYLLYTDVDEAKAHGNYERLEQTTLGNGNHVLVAKTDNKISEDYDEPNSWITKPYDDNASDDKEIEDLFDALVNDDMIKPYMQDGLRHRVEAGDKYDFISMLADASIEEGDNETLERFIDNYGFEKGE